MVLVRLLGPVDVVDGSGAVRSVDSALRRTLLSLLALRVGEVLTADWLLEHAWASDPPDSGLRALRFHISRLRAELGEPDLIETRPGGYRLALPASQVDALAVEAKARAAKLEADPSRVAEIYAEVLAMWRGAPFADAAPCPDLDDEAIRLAELRLTISEDYFQARLDGGAGRDLVADLTRATAREPLRESLWAILITAQYRAGLQADALRSYELMRSTLADSLGLDPSRELQDLQRRVLQHDPSLVTSESSAESPNDQSHPRAIVRHNLPTPATVLIDSSDRLGFARTLLHDHRLVTLTGTGGVGKTRLTIELGWSCLDDFEEGVWLVELAPVHNADAVATALASTLSIRPQPGLTLLESIVDWLRGRELLLIIDNCEHLLDPVRQLLAVVLARSPTVKVVATSREPLGLAGERVHPVDVLNPELDGVALFVDRATAADSSFVLGTTDREAVTEICRRLDGLPLAIELAAARVRSMAPIDLLTRLDDRFRLLRGGVRGTLDRHETLRSTVDWSYRLLTEPEREVFGQLSVFAGGFDLRAAEVVCALDRSGENDMADLLRNLVDKSMVIADRGTVGTRYRILETLRQFGQDQLDDSEWTSALRTRHLLHFVEVAENAENLFRTSDQLIGTGILDREWDNLRRALEWAVQTRDLPAAERMITASFPYAASVMRVEHGEWAEQTIALGTTEHPPRPDTFAQGAHWAFNVENHTRADDLLLRGLDLAISTDDSDAVLIWARSDRGMDERVPEPFLQLEIVAANLDLDRDWWVLTVLADKAPTVQTIHLARLVETAERIRAPTLLVEAALALGHHSIDEQPPDFAAALDLYTQALGTARSSGDLLIEGDCLRAIALAMVGLHPDKAAAACRAALIRLYDIRNWYRLWHLFDSIGLTLASIGDVEGASVVVGNLESHGNVGREYSLGFRDRTLAIVGSRPEFREWKDRGAAMDRHEIVQYALAALQ